MTRQNYLNTQNLVDNNLGEQINLRKLSFLLGKRLNLPKETSYSVVNTLFLVIADELRKNNQISINNFGSFKTVDKTKKKYNEINMTFDVHCSKAVKFESRIKF